MQARAFTDVLVVIVVSAMAFALELALAEYLPWGVEARGVIAVLAGAIVSVWLTLWRGGTLADLGFRRPRRWLTVPFWVLGIFIVFVVAQAAAPALAGQFFDVPQPDMSRYQIIRGNLRAALFFAVALPLAAAVPEEIVYRGFLIDRFTTVFGGGKAGAWLAAVTQAAIFGSVHFQWGVGGILATAIMGLVWGIGYILSGRNLWVVIIAHSLAHVALVTQLYFMPAPP